jgi:hypothetical protein
MNWPWSYEAEKQKGNANRATLTGARKIVAYLLSLIAEDVTSSLQKNIGTRRPKPAA